MQKRIFSSKTADLKENLKDNSKKSIKTFKVNN